MRLKLSRGKSIKDLYSLDLECGEGCVQSIKTHAEILDTRHSHPVLNIGEIEENVKIPIHKIVQTVTEVEEEEPEEEDNADF